MSDRANAVVFRHPDVGEDRAAHTTFEVRLSGGVALAIDGAWPEYVDVAVFFRERLPAEVRAVTYDEAGNHVSPPATAWDDIDAVQADGVEPATFHVVVPLWTLEEGMSDLSLELRLIETYPDALDVDITSIHVL